MLIRRSENSFELIYFNQIYKILSLNVLNVTADKNKEFK